MIPHILHQSWKTKDGLPENFKFWRESFLELNPGLDYRFYDDDDNRALLDSVFPQLLPLYDSFPREIFRVDFIRAIYLFHIGGYYADLDFQCLSELSELSADNLVVGRMGTDDNMVQSIPNAFMASTPGQAFWLGYLANIEASWAKHRDAADVSKRPEYVTGPVILRNTALGYVRNRKNFRNVVRSFVGRHGLEVDLGRILFDEITILPGHMLYPLSWKDQIHRQFLREIREKNLLYTVEEAQRLFPGSAAVTYWAHSW